MDHFPLYPDHESLMAETDSWLEAVEAGQDINETPGLLDVFRERLAHWESGWQGKALAFENERWTQLVSLEPADNTQWRTSLFDDLGPIGHATFPTRLEALLDACHNMRCLPTPNPTRI